LYDRNRFAALTAECPVPARSLDRGIVHGTVKGERRRLTALKLTLASENPDAMIEYGGSSASKAAAAVMWTPL
jgi:hypothetical protein